MPDDLISIPSYRRNSPLRFTPPQDYRFYTPWCIATSGFCTAGTLLFSAVTARYVPYPKAPAATAQLKPPNTAPALATSHTCPKQILPFKNTASAMNPANQKSIVSASSATRPQRIPADDNRWLNLSGMRKMGMSVASDQQGAKMRKETWAGEAWRQCDVHHVETKIESA